MLTPHGRPYPLGGVDGVDWGGARGHRKEGWKRELWYEIRKLNIKKILKDDKQYLH